jgi:hypothetical protein
MSAWLDPIVRALDLREAPVTLFFRDDDAGWADARLFELLDLFAVHAYPIDLAVIPTEVHPGLVDELLGRRAATARIGLHQHGYNHQNHEPNGRPCEFGPSRSAEQQRADIAAGRQLLLEAFGPCLDPVFTPPWNRCADVTGVCLKQCGVTAISRDRSAGPLNVRGLKECPIQIDWFASKHKVRLSRERWVEDASAAIATAEAPLGIMFHHAQMGKPDLQACEAFISMLSGHPAARAVLMCDAIPRASMARRES